MLFRSIGVTSQLNNGQAVSEITVTGNVIRLIGAADNSSDMRMASGISIRNLSTDPVFSSVAQKITISNNSINTPVFYGMLLQSTTFGAEAYLKNVSITGNRINESYYGIVMEYAQYVHITSNDIYFTNNAVLLGKTADFVVQGYIVAVLEALISADTTSTTAQFAASATENTNLSETETVQIGRAHV